MPTVSKQARKPVSVLFDDELDRRIRERAEADDRSVSDQIRHYLRRGLRDDERRPT